MKEGIPVKQNTILKRKIVVTDKLKITVHPITAIDQKEWNHFLNNTSESTFFCTTDWWNTFKGSFLLQIRDAEGKLVGGVPFRTLTVLPIVGKYFKFAWLDSSVLVHREKEEKEKVSIKKKVFLFLADYLKHKGAIVMFVSTKTRSFDKELYQELFHGFEKCATFMNDLTPDEDQMYKSFAKGKRYAIRRGRKSEVNIEIYKGRSGLSKIEDYCQLQNKLFEHKSDSYSDIYFKTQQHLKSILSSENAYIGMAYHKGQPAAGIVNVSHKNVMFGYLGASDNELNRATDASTLLEFEMMKYAKQQGFAQYDFGGTPVEDPEKSDPLYGVHMYKKGYNGEHQQFDCTTFVLRSHRYRFVWWLRKFETNPMVQKIYKTLKNYSR
ncbi:FemAB family protein [Saccharicrinis carchari]|uniref:FemAB family protein n=1 Tax=Saccharicrinis carchari TaxID=1168039 RepID=A0A521BTI2_SACCC|nr:GNAT family N-acetyltransferase [Saccharicrinis carchari]SMO50472.1 FemAB family protein [Saccharicrinis carchari]